MEFFKGKTNIDFMGKSTLTTVLSLVMFTVSIASFLIRGLNLGIDFAGGSLLQLHFQKEMTVEQVRAILRTVDLAAHTLEALTTRNDLDPAVIDDVIMGCVSQAGEQTGNIGRNAVLAAGFPETVPGTSVDRQCGSSQQAIHFAAQGVIAGAYDVVIAAGVESMTRVPMGASVLPG